MEKIETMETFWTRAEGMSEGFLFAMLTDEIVFERWPLAPDEKKAFPEKEGKLLDIRIFNEERELRMFRGDIGGRLRGRMQEETGRTSDTGEDCHMEQAFDTGEDSDTLEYFDEEQYLDIDSACSRELFAREGKVQATGGGRYRLPLAGFENAKIKIRNYLGYYEETGQAYVRDWRLVSLFQEER